MSVDPLPYILSRLKRASENDWSWPLTPVEASRVVAEIERLQDAEARTHQVIVDHAHMFREQGRKEERAAVVAWLRERTAVAERRDISVAASFLEEASDDIKRGEHREEEQ